LGEQRSIVRINNSISIFYFEPLVFLFIQSNEKLCGIDGGPRTIPFYEVFEHLSILQNSAHGAKNKPSQTDSSLLKQIKKYINSFDFQEMQF
jgi:hypothetical protein